MRQTDVQGSNIFSMPPFQSHTHAHLLECKTHSQVSHHYTSTYTKARYFSMCNLLEQKGRPPLSVAQSARIERQTTLSCPTCQSLQKEKIVRHCLNNQCNDRKHCIFVFISRPYEQVCCNKKAIWMNIGERGCILSLAWKQDTDTAASTAFLAYGSHSRPKHITSKHMHTTSICLTWLPRQSRG